MLIPALPSEVRNGYAFSENVSELAEACASDQRQSPRKNKVIGRKAEGFFRTSGGRAETFRTSRADHR